MKYRGRADIVAEILILAKDGTSKTKIMYGAYLSSVQMKDYLAVVIDKGLLEQKEAKYHTTKKGMEFLRHYQAVGMMFHISKSK